MPQSLPKIFIAGTLLACSTQLIADTNNSFAKEMFDDTSPVIDFEIKNKEQFRDINVSVSGPRQFSRSQKYRDGALDLNNPELDDGEYHYEVVAVTNKKIPLRKDRPNNGRGQKERDYVFESVTQTGHFRVKNGQIEIANQDITESDTKTNDK
ncbi:MAG: hypothetical protein K0U68_06985 [Gammaproteobacteria bacterium]|nr:hypothetical protein [Gammaproteobacteria bacterium]